MRSINRDLLVLLRPRCFESPEQQRYGDCECDFLRRCHSNSFAKFLCRFHRPARGPPIRLRAIVPAARCSGSSASVDRGTVGGDSRSLKTSLRPEVESEMEGPAKLPGPATVGALPCTVRNGT